VTGLHIEPMAPTALIAAVALVAVILGAHSWRRRAGRVGRALVMVGIVASACVLLNLTRRTPAGAGGRPTVVVVIDGSASMATPDAGERSDLSRMEALRRTALAPGAQAALADTAAVQALVVRDRPESIAWSSVGAIEPDSERTALAQTIERAIDSAGAGGRVLVLSDGAETERGPGALRAVGDRGAARGVRIDAIAAGSPETARGARVTAWAEPAILFPGQRATVRARVSARRGAGARGRVTLRAGGADGPVIAERGVVLDRETRVAFGLAPAVAPDGGPAVYTVTLEPAGDGAGDESASRSVVIDVLSEAVRVAVFEAEPHWETTFLLDALKADPLVDVTSVTALTRARDVVRRFTPGSAPVRLARYDPATLAEFDVVVLGRGVERWFGGDRALALVHGVTTRGGGLLMARGDPATAESGNGAVVRAALADLEPVRLGQGDAAGGRLGLTEEGRSGPLAAGDESLVRALGEIPALVGTRLSAGEKPIAEVWLRSAPVFGFGEKAEAQPGDPPALAVMRAGEGRVAQTLAGGLWRWAMAPDARADERALYGEFWSRLVRWLALGGRFTPGRLVDVSAAPGSHRPGEPIEFVVRHRRSIGQARPSVEIIEPDGRVSHPAVFRRSPRAWVTTITPNREGIVTVRAEAPGSSPAVTRVVVQEDRTERLDRAARPGDMAAMASAAGGRLWGMGEIDAYIRDVASGPRGVAVGAAEQTEPVWDSPLVFAFLVLLFSGGWIAQRIEGAP